jgi:hypothetical protein
VRLPRDWLGPPEHLIPFGTPTTTEPPQLDQIDFGTPSLGFAPSADAFWGEDSAAIHHPLDAPTGDQATNEQPSRLKGRRWLRFDVRPRRQFAAAAGVAVAALAAAVTVTQLVGAENRSGGVHGAGTADRPAQVGSVPTAALPKRAASAQSEPRHHPRSAAQHRARPRVASHHTGSQPPSGSRSRPAPTMASIRVSSPTPTRSTPTYTPTSAQPHFTSSPGPGVESHSGSGSSSGNPSKATLRSMVTGAGTCSCN